MNSALAFRTFRSVFLSLLLAVGLLVVGCDSNGSNGGGGSTSGTVTATVDGGEATGTIGVNFSYEQDGDTCSAVAFDDDFETPGEKEFDPELINFRCSESNSNEWDAVEVVFNPNGSADGLTLTLTSGGGEIGSTSSPNDTGNLEVTVEADDT